MSFLLDTNVVWEIRKDAPDRRVVTWFAALEDRSAYLSAITWGELRRGAERLAQGRRKEQILAWLEWELPMRFLDRVLPVDTAVADAWGRLQARRDNAGRPIGNLDAVIAATALVHGLTVVTRNVVHFEDTGVAILNPWQ